MGKIIQICKNTIGTKAMVFFYIMGNLILIMAKVLFGKTESCRSVISRKALNIFKIPYFRIISIK